MSHWNVYRNDSATYTDEDGNEQFGVKVWGVRNPDNHRIHYSDTPAEEPAPEQDPMEFVKSEKGEAPSQEAPAPAPRRRQAKPAPAQPQEAPAQPVGPAETSAS